MKTLIGYSGGLPQWKSMPIGSPVSNSHPWKHLYKQHNTHWIGYIYEYILIYIHTPVHEIKTNKKGGSLIWMGEGRGILEGLDEGKEMEKYYNCIITSKIKIHRKSTSQNCKSLLL